MKKALLVIFAFLLLPLVAAADDAADCEAYSVEGNFQSAFPVCLRAAERGDAAAQFYLGVMYAEGEGVEKNNREAAKWYRKSAEQGDAAAQFNLGVMYDNGRGVEKDNREAVKWFRKSAEQGYANAQNNLGWMYEHGFGVKQDKREAAKWYRKSAEQGYARAQNNLDQMYANEDEIEEDKLAAADDVADCAAYAIEWNFQSAFPVCLRAAERGDAGAQIRLGKMYRDGYGVEQDKREALKWFRKAAEQGLAVAQNNLALMYYSGNGVERDYREAVKWYRQAAEQGHAWAQNNLGNMYYQGQGVIEDTHEAYVWFSLAAVTGYEEAVHNKKIAAGYLTASQIRAANKEAKRRLQEIDRRVNAGDSEKSRSALLRDFNAVSPGRTPAETAFENGWRSVVVIKTDENQGSGVVIRPNLVATNCHVVDDGSDIIVYKADNRRAETGSAHSAFIHRADSDKDLCLLEVPGLWGIAANLRSADSLRVGESVYAIGAPKGLDYSLSAGVVSQLRSENGDAPVIQTDVAISPGSSGGGLFDGEGNLAGITTRKITAEDDAEGLSFAIPADWVLDLLE